MVLLVAGLLTLVAASWAADPPGRLSRDVTQLVDAWPNVLSTLFQVWYEVLILWAAVLVVCALLRRQFVLTIAMVSAAVVGLFVAYGSHRFAISEQIDLGEFLRLFTVSEGPAEYPGVRLVAASAVLTVASPAVSRPFRFFGRVVIGLGVIASVGLGVATIAGSVGGLLAGVVAAAAVHLLFGSPGGRPSSEQVRATLAQLGVPVIHVAPAQLEPAGVVLMNATHIDGRALAVKVYGRDAWDGQLIAKLWRRAWYRDDRSDVLLSRLHQVEHEALVTVLAHRAGAPVPDVLVAGQAADDDAAFVATVGGAPLRSIIGDAVDDASVDIGEETSDDLDRSVVELWSAMRTVHDVGIVHGSIDLDRVTLDEHGHPLVIDWSAASVASPATAIDSERAQLLVLAALVVGVERATAIALESIGTERLADVIAYLQAPALTGELRTDVRRREFDLDALRDRVTAASGAEQVELVRLRRVTVKSVLSMALVAAAAMLLVSSLAKIGIDTILDELSTAIVGWVLIALLVAQLARVFSAVSTTGATSYPLRLGPTVILEFAITFVNLVIPSSAARIATKWRYFQKVGMTLPTATAMGAIDSLAAFFVQIAILLSAFVFGVGGIEFDIDIDIDVVRKLAVMIACIVVAVVAIAVAALFLSPKVRERVAGPVRQIRAAAQVVRSPARLLRLFGGNVAAELTFALVLAISLRAYGVEAPIMSLLVINVAVALLGGLMPVPGGIGVAEAGYTAGLVAIGVPEATAFAAAITTRLCTFYLPPIWGYFAMRWLRRNEYL
jgi:uncharacterized membrane protein YbhN (UPF0104 family)